MYLDHDQDQRDYDHVHWTIWILANIVDVEKEIREIGSSCEYYPFLCSRPVGDKDLS